MSAKGGGMKSRKPRPCLSPLASTQTRDIGDGSAQSDTIPHLNWSLVQEFQLMVASRPIISDRSPKILGLYIVSCLCRRQMRVFRTTHISATRASSSLQYPVHAALRMVGYLELGLFCFFHQYGVRWIWFSEINVMVSSLGGHANVLQQN